LTGQLGTRVIHDLDQVCFIENWGMQLAQKKLIDLPVQPETQVI
jgi:hypothetical protein